MGNLCAMFKLFSLPHFIYLILAIGIAVGLIFLFKKAEGNKRKYIGIGLVSTAGLFVLLDFVGKIIVMDNVFENLPINTLHIFTYLMIYMECTKSSTWAKFGYFIMLPVSALSLLFVPNMYLSFSSASISVISHFFLCAVIIIYSILRLIWNDEYLVKKDILNVTINYTIIVAIAHIINVFFRFTVLGVDSNYFGTMGEDYDLIIGLIDKIIPVPFVNIIPLIAVLVGIEFLLILPFDLLRTKKDNREQLEELVALGNLKAQAQYRKNKSGSQILIRSDNKAKPATEKSSSSAVHKDGFVSINKEITVNKDKKED